MTWATRISQVSCGSSGRTTQATFKASTFYGDQNSWTAMVCPFEDWTLLYEVLSHYTSRILGDQTVQKCIRMSLGVKIAIFLSTPKKKKKKKKKKFLSPPSHPFSPKKKNSLYPQTTKTKVYW